VFLAMEVHVSEEIVIPWGLFYTYSLFHLGLLFSE
jgi:hypothetical protein